MDGCPPATKAWPLAGAGRVGEDGTVESLARLREQRAFCCRLSPDRALGSVEEADAFLRDRGLLHVRWGDPEQGIADLTSYLAADSEAEDGEDVAEVLAEARRRLDLVC